jgi:hypothetical protein
VAATERGEDKAEMNYDDMSVSELKDELIKALKAQVENLEKQLRVWEQFNEDRLLTLAAQTRTLEGIAPLKEAIEKAQGNN